MERDYFVHAFGKRLTTLLKKANMTSSVASAGVKIAPLAAASGCSTQMARRYVLGEALPDIHVAHKIATWLKVSPGWLLFGEETLLPSYITQPNTIQIEPDLLTYILSEGTDILHVIQDKEEAINFIIDCIDVTMHMKAEKQEIMKAINISIKSILRFNGIKKNGKT